MIDRHALETIESPAPQITPFYLGSLSYSASTIVIPAPRSLRKAHPLLELLKEGRGLHRLAGLAGDVVDGLLPVLHAGHVIFQARHLLPTLCAVIPQQICNHRNIAIRTANNKYHLNGDQVCLPNLHRPKADPRVIVSTSGPRATRELGAADVHASQALCVCAFCSRLCCWRFQIGGQGRRWAV